MGEAKARAALQAESLVALASVPISEKDVLQAATCIALLGDFWPRDVVSPETGEKIPAETQLMEYWRYMRRAIPVERVPAVWNRVRCLTEAMANNHDILVLFGGQETESGIAFDPQGDLFLRVCSTMPVMPNAEGARSITANVYCPHDVIISLAAGPT